MTKLATPVRAIFFDIDGTLVSFDTHTIAPSTRRAIEQLRADGIKIFIATGRPIYLIDTAVDIPFDGYITCNGAYCADADRRPVYCAAMAQGDLEALIGQIDADPFPVVFVKEHEWTINLVDDHVRTTARHAAIDVPNYEAPRRAIEAPIFQLCVYVDAEREAHLLRHVLPNCVSNRWSPLFTDINPVGNTKQTGMDHLLAHFGIDRAATMAFGDGGNDIQMLRHAATGIAMGNASDAVKAAADWVTDHVDADGIANALRHFGLLADG